MPDWKDKLALIAQRNRQEIVAAKLSRRELMRLGLLTTGGTLIAKAGLSSRAFAAGVDDGSLTAKDSTLSRVPASPPMRPWVAAMPRLSVKKPVDFDKLTCGLPKNELDGGGSGSGGDGSGGGDKYMRLAPDGYTPIDAATKKVPHQFFSVNGNGSGYTDKCGDGNGNTKFYEFRMQEAMVQMHPDYAKTKVWGFDGQVPGPLVQARYGEPVMIRYPQPPSLGEGEASLRHCRDEHPSAQRPYPVRKRRQPGQLLQLGERS